MHKRSWAKRTTYSSELIEAALGADIKLNGWGGVEAGRPVIISTIESLDI